MSNLSPDKSAAIDSGSPVRQTWSIKVPINAAHTVYVPIVIDEGILSTSSPALSRVIKAGSRSHSVWNPHPMEDSTPKAVRYAIEVANGDGYFFAKSGGVFNPYGLYQASPAECFLLHSVAVLVAGNWQPVAHMDYIGRIIEVSYSGGGSMVRRNPSAGTTAPGLAPRSATIISEQMGAWETLRRVFGKDDAHVINSFSYFTVSGTEMTLASISPSTVADSGGTFVLTCTGTGFATAGKTLVTFDNKVLTTTYVSATSMTANVGGSQISAGQTYQIRVHRPGPGGYTTLPKTLTVT